MWVSCGSGWSAEIAPHESPRWKKGLWQFLRKYQIIVMLLLAMLNTSLWCQAPCFWHGESYGTIFVSLRSVWRPRTGWMGCRRPRTSSRSEIITLVLRLNFGVTHHVFWHGESYGTIFVSHRSIWSSRTGWRGCRMPRTSSRSEITTLVLKVLVT